ncbi:MAG: hypothetical protein K6A30_06635 [Lachnospiraceae bacterium]|nr:hypothetical protein [Lachnospiraceae bacterium]
MIRSLRGKATALLLAVALSAGSLTGCSVAGAEVVWTSSLGRHTVFKIGDEKCTLTEAKVFLVNYRNMYTKNFGNQSWKQKHKGETLEEFTKDATLTQLAKMKTMVQLAEKKKISLTEDEQESVKKCAKQYYDSLTKDEIHYMRVSESKLEDLYSDMALATKLYEHLTGGVNEEVSDDDARVMDVEQIVMDDEKVAKKVGKKIANGSDFLNLASNYSTSNKRKTSLYRQNISDTLAAGLEKLDDGEISDLIMDDDGTYYYIKVINKIDRELTEENKAVIVKERAAAAFDNVYNSYVQEIPSTFNHKMWDKFTIDTEDELKTSSFFSVFDDEFSSLKQE